MIHNCIVCNQELWENDDDQCIISGSKLKIVTGYGSEHDGDVYHGWICDQCIIEKDKPEVIEYQVNYMFADFDKETHRKLLFTEPRPFPGKN